MKTQLPLDPTTGQPLYALRLYFNATAKTRPTRFWHLLGAPNLGSHLLHKARHQGIRQALLHKVTGGYLPGERLVFDHAELPHPSLPQCLELIDTQERLSQFLKQHVHEHQHVQALLFKCEPLPAVSVNDNHKDHHA